jgi:hypothetical protein
MSENFDPYYKWLGIPPKDQPPSHYRLLGLELLESDPEVIDRAANRLMDYLQSITDNEHLAQSQALLNEIAAARLCLLDKEQKGRYDENLRAEKWLAEERQRAEKRSGSEKIAAGQGDEPSGDQHDSDQSGERGVRTVRGKRAKRTAPPAAPPVAPPTIAPPVQRKAAGGHDARPRQNKSAVGLVIGLAACLLVVGGLALWVLVLRPDPQKASATGKSRATADGTSNSGKSAKSSGILPENDFPEPPAFGKSEETGPVPPAKEQPPPEPRPETSKLWEAANDAIKKKDVKEAIDLLQKYLDDPAAPEAAVAQQYLDALRSFASDEFLLDRLATMTERQMAALERNELKIEGTGLPPELVEIFADGMRRNLPEAKRRLAMKSIPEGAPKEKEKSPPDAKTATTDPKPATPDPMPPSTFDPLTQPAEFLGSQGLTRRGTLWQLNEEPALTATAALASLEKNYTAAAAKTADGLKELNKVRAQLTAAQQQADQAQVRGAKPSQQVTQFIEQWRPKIGDKMALGGNAELRTLLLGRIGPRNDLLLAVLKARQALGPLDETYRRLAEDSRVAEALSKLPGEKVGPSAKLGQVRAKFVKTEGLVLADETPLFLKDRETMLSVIINESVPAELAYLTTQDFNIIPEALVKKLGIAIDANAPRVTIERTIEGNKQLVPARQITIASIRLGKHLLKDKPFLATGPEGADMGAGLGSKAFEGFRFETDYDNFVFKIRPEDAPDPKPKKKPAR